ncbi:unnamed protein product [Polarella glacialis]|nr:unnamed protein product [Polarella glacialis]
MYGSPDSLGYGQLASKLAALSGAVVMLPDIPLLPIANYSGWIKASLAALQYLVSNDPPGCSGPDGHEAPIFIGGDSAGGGTALSLMLELNMNPFLLPNGKRLSGGFFFSPWTNLMCNTPEYYNHAFAKIVDRKSFKGSGEGESDGSVYVGDIMFHGKPNSNAGGFQLNSWEYVGSRKLLTDPVASPMYAQRKEIEGVGGGLPPLYFATGGSESILGDSVIFAQKAARFGVKIRMDIFEGMWHVFPMYSEGCGLGEALAPGVIALDRTAQHVRHLALYGKPFFQTAPGIPYTHHEYDHTMENREQWWGPDDAESWPAGPSDAAVEKSSSADDLKQRRKKDEAQASEEAKQKHNDEVKARDEEEREAKDEVHHTHSGPGAKSNGEAKDESRKDAESKGHVTPQFPTADPQSGNNAAGLELLAAAMLGSFSTLMAVMVLLAFTPSTLVARAMKAAGLTGNDAVGSHLCSTTAAMPLLSGHAVGSP